MSTLPPTPSISNTPKYVIPALRLNTSASPIQQAETNPDEDAFIPQGKSGLIKAKKDVSQSHVRKADWIILALPEGLQRHFRKKGCEVKLARTMDEIVPNLTGSPDEKTGLEKKRAWNEVTGYAKGTVIAVPEFVMKPSKGALATQVQPSRGLNVLRHELGHVLHNTSPLLYDEDGANDEFYEAYTEDLTQLSPQDRKRFHYGIQTEDIETPTAAGMKEAFAEVFASLYGGGTIDSQAIQNAFPRTKAYMAKAVKELIRAETDQ